MRSNGMEERTGHPGMPTEPGGKLRCETQKTSQKLLMDGGGLLHLGRREPLLAVRYCCHLCKITLRAPPRLGDTAVSSLDSWKRTAINPLRSGLFRKRTETRSVLLNASST